MKRLMLLLFVVSFFHAEQATAQVTGDLHQKEAIIGLWQDHSEIVGSWLLDNWRFFQNGRFTYTLSDALNPLQSISGRYYIQHDRLFLQVTDTKQLVGATVVAPEPAFEFGTFRLDGGRLMTIKQTDTTYADHPLKIINSDGKKAIQIDDGKYYQVSKDPSAHS
jgi:hypothetical protein